MMKFATPSSSLASERPHSVILLRRAPARPSSDPAFELVRQSLAHHLRIEAGEIHEDQELGEDLGLDPLDLVLVAIRLEEQGHVEFPVAELAGVMTVADLTAMVRSWWRPAVSASQSRRSCRR